MADDQSSSTVLAFDLGGTRIKAGLICDGRVIALDTALTSEQAGAEGVLSTLSLLASRLLPIHPVGVIGIAIKGIVDPEQGVLLDVNDSLTSLIGQPLAAHISARLGYETFVENDARMYALGEFAQGAGRGCQNMVCLTLGTGVGCGVVLGGRVLRGPRGVSGILAGHLTVDVKGERCTCGNIGCLETLIGTKGLVRQAGAHMAMAHDSTLMNDALNPPRIFRAAVDGDDAAIESVTQFTRELGAGIVTMIHAYDPDRVVLGGGLAQGLAPFLPTVQAYVDAHAWTIPRGRVRIVPAALGDAAALVGVAEMARHRDIFM